MKVERRVILTLVGAVLVVVVIAFALRQQEADDIRRETEFDRRWGADFRGLCSASWPERLGPVDDGAKVAFLVPPIDGYGNSTVRVMGLGRHEAGTRADLTHLACVQFPRVVVSRCEYEGGVWVERRRYDAAVKLVDVRSKAIVAKWTKEGVPPPCPPTISRRRNDPKPSPIDGREADFVNGLLQLDPFKRR